MSAGEAGKNGGVILSYCREDVRIKGYDGKLIAEGRVFFLNESHCV